MRIATSGDSARGQLHTITQEIKIKIELFRGLISSQIHHGTCWKIGEMLHEICAFVL